MINYFLWNFCLFINRYFLPISICFIPDVQTIHKHGILQFRVHPDNPVRIFGEVQELLKSGYFKLVVVLCIPGRVESLAYPKCFNFIQGEIVDEAIGYVETSVRYINRLSAAWKKTCL